MAENPLATLARVLGGVVLTQGSLGHQVLGQLLLMNTHEVALAAAATVVAGTAGQRSMVGQIALRTIAPALAVRVLLNKQEERLQRKALRLDERERELIRQRVKLHRKRWNMRAEKARSETLRVFEGMPVSAAAPEPSTAGAPESLPGSIPASPFFASLPAAHEAATAGSSPPVSARPASAAPQLAPKPAATKSPRPKTSRPKPSPRKEPRSKPPRKAPRPKRPPDETKKR